VFWRRSIYRSVHAAFSDLLNLPHGMYPHGNDCLRNTHSASIFCDWISVLIQKSLQLTVLNLPGPIFTLLVTQVKIVVIETGGNQSLHVVDKALSP